MQGMEKIFNAMLSPGRTELHLWPASECAKGLEVANLKMSPYPLTPTLVTPQLLSPPPPSCLTYISAPSLARSLRPSMPPPRLTHARQEEQSK